MNGVAAGSWTDGVYAIVKTEDWEQLLREIMTDDLMSEGADEGTVIVAICKFLMRCTAQHGGPTKSSFMSQTTNS